MALEHHELAQLAGTPAAHLVALRGAATFPREVQVSTWAGIEDTPSLVVVGGAGHDELLGPARPRGVGLVALAVLGPEEVAVLA